MVVSVIHTSEFKRAVKSLDNSIKIEVKKRMLKITEDPEIGKPLRYNLKGEREVYVGHFRLIYEYKDNTIVFLKFRHKDEAGMD